MLGWRILRHGDYLLNLPCLGKEEEELIIAVGETFKEAARQEQKEPGEAIRNSLPKVAEERGFYLDRNQQRYLSDMACLHIYGLAFIEPILLDDEVEEISIIGVGKPAYVFIRNQGWKQVNAEFTNEKAMSEFINRMARCVGRHITLQNPRLDAMLPDGSRLHASLPPISNGEMTIRKFREQPFSPKELVEKQTTDARTMALLSIIMQTDCSLLIAGNTASGKTSTLNALFSFVPANERIIITEETPEISLPHKHQLRLVANKDMGISLQELVYDSLRMRPDRMIVGEVRNKQEASALFDVLLAGQARGSYATFHAQSSDEALLRLRSFGINENDLDSIDCIVIQRRMMEYCKATRSSTEVRRIVEIAEVCSGNTRQIKTNELDFECKLLERAGDSFGMNRKEIMEELELRTSAIENANIGCSEFFEKWQKQFYRLSDGDE